MCYSTFDPKINKVETNFSAQVEVLVKKEEPEKPECVAIWVPTVIEILSVFLAVVVFCSLYV
jgi:hypothetical protein